jgi:hypothetical protein
VTTIYDAGDMDKLRPSSFTPRSRHQSAEGAAITPDSEPKLSEATATNGDNDPSVNSYGLGIATAESFGRKDVPTEDLDCAPTCYRTVRAIDSNALLDGSASDATDSNNMDTSSSMTRLQDEDDSGTTKLVLTEMDIETDESVNPEATMADHGGTESPGTDVTDAVPMAVNDNQYRSTKGAVVFAETGTTEANTLLTTVAITTIQDNHTKVIATTQETASLDAMISKPAVSTENCQGQFIEERALLDQIESLETRDTRSDITTSQNVILKPGIELSPRELSTTRHNKAEHVTAQVASSSKAVSKSKLRLHNRNAVSKCSAKTKTPQSSSIITNFTKGEVIVIDDDDEQDRIKLETAESASITLKEEQCMDLDHDDTEADDAEDGSSNEGSDETTTGHRTSPRKLHDGLLPWGDKEFEAQNGSKVENLFERLQWHWIRFYSLKSMHSLLCVQAFHRQVIPIIEKTSNKGHLAEADLDKLHKGCTKFVACVSKRLREGHEKRKVQKISKLVRRLCDEGNVKSLIESYGMTDGDKSDKSYKPARK